MEQNNYMQKQVICEGPKNVRVEHVICCKRHIMDHTVTMKNIVRLIDVN